MNSLYCKITNFLNFITNIAAYLYRLLKNERHEKKTNFI